MDEYLVGLTTENVNIRTKNIDECDTETIIKLINEEDQLVPLAVKSETKQIAAAVDLLYDALKDGGRMIYVGAGTSGRLGVLDASECPPTFGTDPQLVQGYIAGGDSALRNAAEGCEDDPEAGAELIDRLKLHENDVIIGISASGSAAYVLGAIGRARQLGRKTIGIVNNRRTKLESVCDITIAPVVGPEVIIGSTRMKSGTAQKLVLNMLTTAVMIKLGKVYNNLMVDLKASNKKLYDRSIRIICSVTGVDAETAAACLKKADMNAKTAILMLQTGLNYDQSCKILEGCDGRLKKAIGEFVNK